MTSVFQVYPGSSVTLCSHSELAAFDLFQLQYGKIISTWWFLMWEWEFFLKKTETLMEGISHVYVLSKPPYSYTEVKSGKNLAWYQKL